MKDSPPFSTKQTCKIASALKFQIAKMAYTFSIFGQIKHIVHVSFVFYAKRKLNLMWSDFFGWVTSFLKNCGQIRLLFNQIKSKLIK